MSGASGLCAAPVSWVSASAPTARSTAASAAHQSDARSPLPAKWKPICRAVAASPVATSSAQERVWRSSGPPRGRYAPQTSSTAHAAMARGSAPRAAHLFAGPRRAATQSLLELFELEEQLVLLHEPELLPRRALERSWVHLGSQFLHGARELRVARVQAGVGRLGARHIASQEAQAPDPARVGEREENQREREAGSGPDQAERAAQRRPARPLREAPAHRRALHPPEATRHRAARKKSTARRALILEVVSKPLQCLDRGAVIGTENGEAYGEPGARGASSGSVVDLR